ncbi:hypothetical protein B8A12_03190 [Staphylococcus aureus]|nr:hypothetical protein B8A14_08410 [Staphylococcus aureus]ORN84684.1 hypothetical protein B7986_06580 [Staphylococcus aureus]ORN94090.1 hypothetical protein B8A12_03190 [Staphylococcus aureus]ORO01977.1 hypothetical protein B8A05_08850 [Staphylococcus aureus]ORO02386.1 hypothetical protein B8A06_12740 [Staphylococcus aureus]
MEEVTLHRCPTPTCIACRNWCSNSSMLGSRQLALFVYLLFVNFYVGSHLHWRNYQSISFFNRQCVKLKLKFLQKN